MSKTLILTEKPSVARDFARGLGIRGRQDGYIENDTYIITWAVGHLVALFEPQDYNPAWGKWRFENLPVIPETYQYKPIQKTVAQLNVIRKLLRQKNIERIVVATDAGREGEVIARTVLLTARSGTLPPMLRFWTSQALTPRVVKDAMNALKPATAFDRLWDAGRARQIADWLVGMNGSRAATIKLKDLFSVGRVQTAVLALLAARRKERDDFKPEPYWLVRALFRGEKGTWQGIWVHGGKSRIAAREQALGIVAGIQDRQGVVSASRKTKKSQPPPLLYSLTDLQQDANIRFGLSAKQTLQIAQELYERKKCLSYPRTDARVLGTDNVAMVQKLIGTLTAAYPNAFAGLDPALIDRRNKRVFNDEKLTDHHALIPLASLPANVRDTERNVYMLVLQRFAAAFYPDCLFETAEILTTVAGDLTFRTRGQVILRPGWQAVLKRGPGKTKKGDDEPVQDDLPPLEKGDVGAVVNGVIEDKKTAPPPEYTDALLLKDMTNPGRYVDEADLKRIYRGNVGLGTQATRAQIIETLLARSYARREKKKLLATKKGVFLIDTLETLDTAGTLASPEKTALWEMELERIAAGRGSVEAFLAGIEKFVRDMVREFKSHVTGEAEREVVGSCPSCGRDVVAGFKTFACSGSQSADGGCPFVIWKTILGKKISPAAAKMLLAGKSVGPYRGFVSKKKKRFSAALKLENENGNWGVRFLFDNAAKRSGSHTDRPPVSGVVKSVAEDVNDLGGCPVCGGKIIRGKRGYGCANWRQVDGGCRFVIWEMIGGKTLTPANIKQLTALKTTRSYVFKGTNGSKFRAKLKLEKKAEKFWETTLIDIEEH